MNNLDVFQNFLSSQNININLGAFVVNLLLAGFFAYILQYIYIRFGKGISNRELFSHNFVTITMTTMFIISIVRSSLALSLGLVGALSIVRFRTAIKEPEELAYLFICISLGLAFGAGQRLVAIIAFIILVGVLVVRGLFSHKKRTAHSLFLTISTPLTHAVSLKRITETLNTHVTSLALKRSDETQNTLEASFYITLGTTHKLHDVTLAVKNIAPEATVSIIDDTKLV